LLKKRKEVRCRSRTDVHGTGRAPGPFVKRKKKKSGVAAGRACTARGVGAAAAARSCELGGGARSCGCLVCPARAHRGCFPCLCEPSAAATRPPTCAPPCRSPSSGVTFPLDETIKGLVTSLAACGCGTCAVEQERAVGLVTGGGIWLRPALSLRECDIRDG